MITLRPEILDALKAPMDFVASGYAAWIAVEIMDKKKKKKEKEKEDGKDIGSRESLQD